MSKKNLIAFLIFTLIIICVPVVAQTIIHTVVPGDSLWKIATKYQVGVSEIVKANPQISNPSLIIPGQKLTIPNYGDVKVLEDKIVTLVNQERSNRGLSLLKSNWQLSRTARYKSQDMAIKGYFDHYSPTYGSPFQMMESFGIRFTAAGENIAKGQRTTSEVMNSWMNSPGHRSNILSPTYNQLGVGVAKTASGVYVWTQMFIKIY